MAHNSGYVPDAAVRIGWPDAVLGAASEAASNGATHSGTASGEQRFASGTGPPSSWHGV